MGNLVTIEPNLFLELFNGPVEFFARIRLEHRVESLVAEFPNLILLLGVGHPWNFFSNLVRKGNIGDFFATSPINWILKARVVCFLDAVAF